MTDRERVAADLRASADALDDMAAWCLQPDMPSAVYGFVSAEELRLKAAAMRATADAFGGETSGFSDG